MEALSHSGLQELLRYLPYIKSTLKEWQLVDVRLTDPADRNLTMEKMVAMLQGLFSGKEGKIYPCSAHEMFMLIRWGLEKNPLLISTEIEAHLPPGSCKVFVHEPTPEGLNKLEIQIQQPHRADSSFSNIRTTRRENVVMVADDDMYMRLLINKGVPLGTTVQEVANGNEIITAYKNTAPDILFLDIHLPGRSGMDILSEIKQFDPEAYIVMLSADSSRDNVANALQQGAFAFMTKPFTKEKLAEHLKKCPTFS